MNRPHHSQGYVLVSVIALSVVLLLMVTVSSQIALSSMRTTSTEARKSQAFYAAQSGVERVMARIAELKLQALPLSVTNDLQVAQWLAGQLNDMQASLPEAGRFAITATADSSAGGLPKLNVLSQGFAQNDGSTRRIAVSFPVSLLSEANKVGPMLAGAPAALTITGNSSINGSAPIAGDNNDPGTIHHMGCPPALSAGATCQKSGTDPDTYTLTYTGSVPSTFVPGKILRPTQVPSGAKSEERYIVEDVNKDTKAVKLTVLSDYISTATGLESRRTFSSSGDIPMQERSDIPALIAPPGANFTSISANVKDTCTTFACEHYTMSPENLFKMIMGGSRDEMKQRFQQMNTAIPGTYNTSGTAGCAPNVQWLKLSGSTANLNQCPNGQLVVIDARGQSSLDINLPTQSSFRGLLYVLADNGVNVKVAANVGFAGAVLMDNGQGGIDLRGTGGFNLDCADTQQDENLKKLPKLCYDAAIMGQVRQGYIDTMFTTRRVNLSLNGGDWAEVGQ